jgi:hypothetical protein
MAGVGTKRARPMKRRNAYSEVTPMVTDTIDR